MRTIIFLSSYLLSSIISAQPAPPQWQQILQSVTPQEQAILQQGWQWIDQVRQEETKARAGLKELNWTFGRSAFTAHNSTEYPDRLAAIHWSLQQKLEQANAFFDKNLRSIQKLGGFSNNSAFQPALLWEYAQICVGDLEILKLTFLETAVAIAQQSWQFQASFFEIELAQLYDRYGMKEAALQLLLDMDVAGIEENTALQKDRLSLLCSIYLDKDEYAAALPYAQALAKIVEPLYSAGQLNYQEAIEILITTGDVFEGLQEWEQAKIYFEQAESIARDSKQNFGPNFLHGKAYSKAAQVHGRLGDPSWQQAFDQLYSPQVINEWLTPQNGVVDSLFIASLLYDMGKPEQAALLLNKMDLRAQTREPLNQYLSPVNYLTSLRKLSHQAKIHGEIELLKKINYALVIDLKFQIFYAQEGLSNYALSQLVGQFREDFRQYQISNLLSDRPDLSKLASTTHYASSEINNLIRNNEQVGVFEASKSVDPFEKNLYQEWVDIKSRLSGRYSGGYDGTEPDIIATEMQLVTVENLMRLSQVYLKNPTTDGVFGGIETNLTESTEMSLLRKDEAIVEFVRIPFNGKNFDATDENRYYAISRRNVGDPEELEWDEEYGMVKMYYPPENAFQFTYLFEEKELKNIIGQNTNSMSDGIAALYQSRGAGAVNAPRTANLSQLYQLIWQPLENQLEGIKKIYYTKSGMLNQIALAALPAHDGQLLTERFELFTKNGTDRLSIENERGDLFAENPTAVVYGGIDFNNTESAGSTINSENLLANNSRSLLHSATQRGAVGSWPYLAGTKTEVEKLMAQFKNSSVSYKYFEAAQATEESFKHLGIEGNSPDILHIATHGFFLPEKVKGAYGSKGFGDCENPLIRSGLLMAGGNRAWAGDTPADGSEDGILTAYEISVLNLKNTKLAVLSACETGLGDLEGAGIGEEVHGLQRAFKLAGVDYIIMSLWKVPDAETVVFMETFYKKWLGGMSVRRAFRASQLELSKIYKPYEWAAFVLIN